MFSSFYTISLEWIISYNDTQEVEFDRCEEYKVGHLDKQIYFLYIWNSLGGGGG